MTSDRYTALWQALLAAGGPVAALLVQYGLPESRANAWAQVASALVAIVTPALSALWSARSHNPENTLRAAARNDPAISIVVPDSATSASKAVAADEHVANVNTPAGEGK